MAAEPDYSAMSEADLFAAMKDRRRRMDTVRDELAAELGRLGAELHGRGLTWSQIAREVGVNLTTAYRWSRPYLPADTE